MISLAEALLLAAIAVTLIGAATGWIVHRAMHQAGRLRRHKRVGWTWFGVISVAALAWSAYYWTVNRSLNDALSLFLAVEGSNLGLFAAFILMPGRRRIVIIAKARNSFTSMIVGGVTDRLQQESGWDVTALVPPPEAAETSHGVTEQLGSLVARQADGIVLIAGDVDENLHLAVLERLRDGVTVIACDARLDDDYFFGHGVAPPRYVGSNFVQGGREVAGFVKQRATADDLIFVFCGPAGNRPAVERCRVALYELMLSERAANVRTVQIKSFDATEIADKFSNRVVPLIDAAKNVARVFIYCGNDENALIVVRCVRETARLSQLPFLLVGYDGVRDSRSALLVEPYPNIAATVDTLPHRLGQSAADLLFAVKVKSVEASRKSVIINPSLWERT